MSRADIVLRAHAIGTGLTDLERIALGATLIQTVLRADRHQAVLLAARHIHEHGEALMDASLGAAPLGETTLLDIDTLTYSDGPHIGRSTHGAFEQLAPSERPGTAVPGSPGRSALSSLRAAWAYLCALDAQISNSILGDGIAGFCVGLLFLAALFAPLLLPQ